MSNTPASPGNLREREAASPEAVPPHFGTAPDFDPFATIERLCEGLMAEYPPTNDQHQMARHTLNQSRIAQAEQRRNTPSPRARFLMGEGALCGDTVEVSSEDGCLYLALGAALGAPAERVADDIAQADYRRNTMQAEAAINLAIGYVMSYCGYTYVEIKDEALAEFSRKRKVTAEPVDGGYRYTVRSRP